MRPKQHETSIIRDIRRKIAGRADLEVAFPWSQIRSQQQRQRGWKLYSFHAPEVECIGKGKASAPYAAAPRDRREHAATMPQIRAASSSQAKSAGSSAA